MSRPAPLPSPTGPGAPAPVLPYEGTDPASLSFPGVDGPSVMRRITWRLVPFLCLLYVVNYLDRTNISMAKLQMLRDLRLDDAAYGFGSGIFYVGYFLFEVPSNLLLERVGARRWIARIMLTWGVISTLMTFVKGAGGFYLLRFLLGFAEAGFFPGIVLYLTYWVPPRQRARTMAAFLTSIALSGIIGNPLAGALMKMEGLAMPGLGQLHGWQWVFLVEGLPPILLAFAVVRWLPDGPHAARWLLPNERGWVWAQIEKGYAEAGDHVVGGHVVGGSDVEHAPDVRPGTGAGTLDYSSRRAGGHGAADLRRALADGRLWLMCGIYFMLIMGLYGFIYWVPTMVKALGANAAPVVGASVAAPTAPTAPTGPAAPTTGPTVVGGMGDLKVGFLSAIPYLAAAVSMVVIGHHSDRTGERRWHVAGCALLAAGALSALSFRLPGLAVMVALCLAAVGIFGALAPFWVIPTRFLRGTAAAGGIALINCIGNLAGLVSNSAIGWITQRTQHTSGGMLVVAVSLVLGAVMVLSVPRSTEGTEGTGSQ